MIGKKEMIDETGVPEPVLRAVAETGEIKRAAVDPDIGEIGNNQEKQDMQRDGRGEEGRGQGKIQEEDTGDPSQDDRETDQEGDVGRGHVASETRESKGTKESKTSVARTDQKLPNSEEI